MPPGQLANLAATAGQVAALDAYEAMPVSMFGEALMRGMGWEEGKGVGRNNNTVAPTFMAWSPKLGHLPERATAPALLSKA